MRSLLFSTLFLIGISFGYQISGTIYEDLNGDSNISDDGVGIPGVKVYLYRDDGDSKLGSGDSLVEVNQTDSDGNYSFSPPDPGVYWVVVDSLTIAPTEGVNDGNSSTDLWAEQSFGSAGVYCDTDQDPATPPEELGEDGACYGGAYGDRSDLFAGADLSKAEHYGRGEVNDSAPTQTLNFGFSFNIVVNVNDRDDYPDSNRSSQGSFRQFLTNSNGVTGENQMRFVPAVPANRTGGSGEWWGVDLNLTYDSANHLALPPITDSDTGVIGIAYSPKDGVSVLDPNPGVVGHSGEEVGVGADGVPETGDEGQLPNFYRKELEINLNQKGDGLILKGGGGVVTEIAIWGAENYSGSTLIKVEGNSSVVTGNFIGVDGEGTPPSEVTSTFGVDLLPGVGDGNISGNFVDSIGESGILFEGEGVVSQNEVNRSGVNSSCGAGISVVITNGTDTPRAPANLLLTENYISNSAGYGVLGDPAGAFQLENSTIVGNGVGDSGGNLCSTGRGGVLVKGEGNLVKYNSIQQNSGPGVVVAAGNSTSTGNFISRNSFSNNRGLGIDLDNSGESGDGVTPNDGVTDPNQQNEGMDYPIISYAEKEGNTLRLYGYVGKGDQKIPGTHLLEFYRANDDGDNNGEVVAGDGRSVPHGEGELFLGDCYTSDDGSFECNLTINGDELGDGDQITGVATDSNGSSSEFGANRQVKIVPVIYGYLFDDQNHNGVKELGEGGLEGVTIRLYHLEDGVWVEEDNTTTDLTGYYQFHPANGGSYRVVEDGENLQNPDTGSDLEGWVSTTGNIFETIYEKTRELLAYFGDFYGERVTGRVFEDNGGGDATSAGANNVVQESGERGLVGVLVRGCDTLQCGVELDWTKTGVDGNYTLYIPGEYNGSTVYIREVDPVGYLSTGDNRSGVVDSDPSDPTEERNTLQLEVETGAEVGGYNFADVHRMALNYPKNGNTPGGGGITFVNRINLYTPGKVAIMVASGQGIEYSVAEDLDCDGTPEATLTSDSDGLYWLNNQQDLGAGTYCLQLHGVPPTELEPNTLEELTLFGFEDWKNTTGTNGDTGTQFDDQESVVDTYLITGGSNKLRLEKLVRNLTAGEEFSTKNSAKPGDLVEYLLKFKNIGADPIRDLVISDSIPNNTEIVTGGYNGEDVKVVIGGESYYGSIQESPDTDGVVLEGGILRVDLGKLTGGKYQKLEGGVSGELYYQTKIKK